jgi:hypothetical protein
LLELDLRIPYAGEDGKPVKPESNNGPMHRKSIDHILDHIGIGVEFEVCHTLIVKHVAMRRWLLLHCSLFPFIPKIFYNLPKPALHVQKESDLHRWATW